MPALTSFAIKTAPRQIMNEWTSKPEEILDTYAVEIRANMRNYSIWSGNYVVVIAPQHREQRQSPMRAPREERYLRPGERILP